MGHGYLSHTKQIKNLYQINQKIERYAFVDVHKTLRPHFSTFQTNFVKDTNSLGTLLIVLVLSKHEPLGLPFLKHH
jgi:hypothetical protein